jgi:hypothetical protein
MHCGDEFCSIQGANIIIEVQDNSASRGNSNVQDVAARRDQGYRIVAISRESLATAGITRLNVVYERTLREKTKREDERGRREAC